MAPDICALDEAKAHRLFVALALESTVAAPLPSVRPPLAAKFHPVAAVLPPAMPTVPPEQVPVVPSTKAILLAEADIKLMEQM